MVKKEESLQIVKNNFNKFPEIILSVWYDDETRSLLWDYGNKTLSLKNFYELVGILETIQIDLIKKTEIL